MCKVEDSLAVTFVHTLNLELLLNTSVATFVTLAPANV